MITMSRRIFGKPEWNSFSIRTIYQRVDKIRFYYIITESKSPLRDNQILVKSYIRMITMSRRISGKYYLNSFSIRIIDHRVEKIRFKQVD